MKKLNRIAGKLLVLSPILVFFTVSSCDFFVSIFGLPEVDIRLVGVVIGPTDSQYETWDGTTSLTQDLISQLGEFNAKTKAAAAVLTFLDSFIFSAWDAPEVMGSATIDHGAGAGEAIELSNRDNNTEDSYRPIFPGEPGWKNVKPTKDTKIRLTLIDEDWGYWPNEDDPIADNIVINYDNLVEAYNAGTPTMINVAGQTMDLVMLVSVEVTPSN